jgi:hypothetical protein
MRSRATSGSTLKFFVGISNPPNEPIGIAAIPHFASKRVPIDMPQKVGGRKQIE